MITPYAELPTWVRVVVIVPLGLLFGALMFGWYPHTTRDWRRLGLFMACFAVFSAAVVLLLRYA
jgi:hypothetical protein